MTDQKAQWNELVARALNEIISGTEGDGAQLRPDEVVHEVPRRSELGDLAFPMFPYAKRLRQSPAALASRVAQSLSARGELPGEASAAGPYLNVRFSVAAVGGSILNDVLAQGSAYGRSDRLAGQRIMVEFSSPNTNKPLHLGHLRNDILGESISRILRANGAEVLKVNLINDRGIHICKSMLAYERFGAGRTPEQEGVKSDHFVGDFYVKFNSWVSEERGAEELAREMLRKWEAGDEKTRALWRTMNEWAIGGIEQTYRATGISFDRIYRESETYESGRDEVLKGLASGIFYRDEEGTVWVDLSDIGLDKKVLLRKDGTTVYVTQDIGTAIARHRDYPFERLIYVVASEQDYHFKVLFHVLRKLGFEWARNLYHLSYGMVNLPEGRMKSREGTVVDADDLLAELTEMAAGEIKAKGREEEVGDVVGTSRSIALGALNYYLLQVTPSKDMIFDPRESISFNGNTGPYLQYMGTRIASMLRKYEEEPGEGGRLRPELLSAGDEWQLVRRIGEYPDAVRRACDELNPSIIATYLYELCSTFSRYYHDNPILRNEDRDLVMTRVSLSKAVAQVLRNAFELIAVPFLTRM